MRDDWMDWRRGGFRRIVFATAARAEEWKSVRENVRFDGESRVESMDGTNANANASRTRGDAGRRPRATPFRIITRE